MIAQSNEIHRMKPGLTGIWADRNGVLWLLDGVRAQAVRYEDKWYAGAESRPLEQLQELCPLTRWNGVG